MISHSPHVAIAGAGPAGLLCALLMSSLGIKTTILEKSLVADPWSTKSYSINLNPRGFSALEFAGTKVLEQVKGDCMERRQIIVEASDGSRKSIPKDPFHYACTRPDLIVCLEKIIKREHSHLVTIQRGSAVTKVEYLDESESLLKITLENGESLDCTHVIAADGKWSAVRNSIPELRDKFKVESEPSFGIQLKPCATPERWETDATTVMRSANPKYYIICAPLPDGKFSVSMVCFEEIQEEYPWLKPRNEEDIETWEAEYGARPEGSNAEEAFQDKLANMLQKDLPVFYEDIQGKNTLKSARINRRTSWLKPIGENPVYSDSKGRVALVGDSGHAMTPSVGEGCNCALESAVSLAKSLPRDRGVAPTVGDISAAFLTYGRKRPSEVIPIQMRSAAGNRHKGPA